MTHISGAPFQRIKCRPHWRRSRCRLFVARTVLATKRRLRLRCGRTITLCYTRRSSPQLSERSSRRPVAATIAPCKHYVRWQTRYTTRIREQGTIILLLISSAKHWPIYKILSLADLSGD